MPSAPTHGQGPAILPQGWADPMHLTPYELKEEAETGQAAGTGGQASAFLPDH